MKKPKSSTKKLTTKQQAFVDCYHGNATLAAREAGYTGDANQLGQMGAQNLKLPCIAQAIRARELDRMHGPIMTREQRQEMWTDLSLNARQEKDRLQASKLLAQSECDFITKAEIIYPDEIQYTEEDKEILRQLAMEDAKKRLQH